MRFHKLFFILTVLLLPTQLGYHMWPDWALVLGRRVDYLSPTLFLTDITMFFTVLCWIVEEWKPIRITKERFFFILSFIGFMTVNIVLASHRENAVYQWFKYCEFFVFGQYVYRTKPTTIWWTPLCIALGYSICLTVIQFILQHSIGGPFWLFGERTFTSLTPGIAKLNWCFPTVTSCRELLRPYATFPHPNVLAGFYACCLPVCLYIARTTKHVYQHFIAYLLLVSGILALCMTFSRSAWIVTVIACAYVLFQTGRKRRPMNAFLYTCLFLSLCMVGIPYIRMLSLHDESVFLRQDLLVAAYTLWRQHPWFGIGTGNYIPLLPAVISTKDLFSLQPVHNIFVLLFTEIGVIGISGIGLLAVSTWNRLKTHPSFLHVIPFMTLCILGLIDHYPLTLQQGLLLFTLSLSLDFYSVSKN